MDGQGKSELAIEIDFNSIIEIIILCADSYCDGGND